jgi:hypothetical protein
VYAKIYRNFHHEPFNTKGGWGFNEVGELSGAKMVIPWIIFERDRYLFEQEFPELEIFDISLHTPLSYLLSGGLSVRQLVPSFFYPFILFIERLLAPMNIYLALFTTITLNFKEAP